MPWYLKNRKFFLTALFAFGFFLVGSSAHTQGLPEPTGLSPANNDQVTNFPINLRWNSVKGAKAGYEYEVRYQGNAITQGKTWGESNTSVSIEAFNFYMGSIHQWRVRACASFPISKPWGDDGDCGDSSQFISFTPALSKPYLSSPGNGEEVSMPVRISWGSVSGAASYRYYVSPNQRGADISGNVTALLTEASINSNLLTAGQTYFWQVIAESSKGKNSEISDSRSFTTTFLKPTGISPSGPVPILNLKLKWTFPANAQEFRWYIFDAKTQKQITSRSVPGNSLESAIFIIQDNLPYEQDLKWVVQACLTGGKKCGAISNPLTFKVVVPKPEIIKPEKDNQVITYPYIFEWKKVEDVAYYQYSIPNSIPSLESPVRIEQLSFALPQNYLKSGQSYIFQVRTCYAANCGDWAQRSFTTASLSVALSADSANIYTSGSIKLTASVSGASTGATVNYTFYCDNPDKDTVVKPGYIVKSDGVPKLSFTTDSVCSNAYTEAKTYTAKVIVQRDGIDIEKRLEIKVSLAPTGLYIDPKEAKSIVSTEGKIFQAFYDPDGQGKAEAQDKTASSDWTTDKPEIISVKDKSLIVCQKPGIAEITATWQTLSAKAKVTCEAAPTPPIAPTGPTLSLEAEKCVNETGGCSDRKACCLSKSGAEGTENDANYLETIVKYCHGAYDSSMCVNYLPYSPKDQPVIDCVKNRLKAYGNTYTEQTLKTSIIPDCEKQLGNTLSSLDLDKLINEIRATGGINAPATQPTAGGGGGGNGLFSGIKCKNATTTPGAIDNPLCVEDFNSLINVIINFIFWAVIALSPIMMLVAGFYYMTSAGNVAKVALANKMILYTAIGLGVILLAKGLIAIIKGVLGV